MPTIKRGMCLVNFGPENQWKTCVLKLKQKTRSQIGEIDNGTLSICVPSQGGAIKEHLSLADVTSVTRYGEKTLAIFTSSRSRALSPIQLEISTDIEMEDWASSSFCQASQPVGIG